jgi:hypothetical protein
MPMLTSVRSLVSIGRTDAQNAPMNSPCRSLASHHAMGTSSVSL